MQNSNFLKSSILIEKLWRTFVFTHREANDQWKLLVSIDSCWYTQLWFMTSTLEIFSFNPKLLSISPQWEIAAKDAFNFGKIAENVRCLRIVIQLGKRIHRDFKTVESSNLVDKPCFKLEIWEECKLFHCELA